VDPRRLLGSWPVYRQLTGADRSGRGAAAKSRVTENLRVRTEDAGPAMCTYTAVLLADTATPAWHEARHDLPVLFAGSAPAGGAGAAPLCVPVAETAPVRRHQLAG
jgi:formate-dependent nitrite reductase membrane component NrfD